MVAGRRNRFSGTRLMRAALGFGVSGPHGARWFREGKLARLIAQALDGGVRHFDTAPFYGEAEERLGRALQGRSDIFISTKTGTRRAGRRLVKDFSPAGMRADVEGSLLRLKREAVDVIYLHGPAPAEVAPALAALAALPSAALDLTLVDLKADNSAVFDPARNYGDCTANVNLRAPEGSVDMGTGFDCFSTLSHTLTAKVSEKQRENRALLRNAMRGCGFYNNPSEWWHYTLRGEPFPETYFNFPVE